MQNETLLQGNLQGLTYLQDFNIMAYNLEGCSQNGHK